jgi:hypothetical protein
LFWENGLGGLPAETIESEPVSAEAGTATKTATAAAKNTDVLRMA